MIISKEFKFDSAHFLPWHIGLCRNMHGHTYRLIVSIVGDLNENAVVIDFSDLKKIVQKNVIDVLDHHCLNNIVKNPTAENLVIWILETLKDKIKFRSLTVRLYETPTSYVQETLDKNGYILSNNLIE